MQVRSSQINRLTEIWAIDVGAGIIVALFGPTDGAGFNVTGIDAADPVAGGGKERLWGLVDAGFELICPGSEIRRIEQIDNFIRNIRIPALNTQTVNSLSKREGGKLREIRHEVFVDDYRI